jgi:YD repeat-containing protein
LDLADDLPACIVGECADPALSDWLGTSTGGFTDNAANSLQGVGTDWKIVGTGDFNGDGRADILWRNNDGRLSDWLGTTTGGFSDNYSNTGQGVPVDWKVAGTGDFNGDGRADILWRNDNGAFSDWLGQANGGFVVNDANAWNNVPINWQVAGTGKFDSDGRSDIVWRDSSGLFRTWQGQANGGFAAGNITGSRITTYAYSAGGRLASMNDAAGGTHNYDYDAAGNQVRDSYTRVKSDGSTVTEGILSIRDGLGRTVSQTIATKNADGSWTRGDKQDTRYDIYGEVSARGVNGLWQESFSYNNRGLLEKTNTGDGVWRFYVYDKNGNQVLAIESAGKDYSSSSISTALADVGTYGTNYTSGVNATISVYDKRGQVVQVRQPQRETSAIGSALTTIVNSTTYNAFGEAASQTDALNNVTTFTYNVMGRLIQKVMPQVSVTSAAGAASNTNPTECYYYDLSGRLVGSADADGFSTDYLTTKANATTRSLLAGTGHNGSDALVTAEYHRDGGIKKTAYDVFGDARTLTDELNRNETHSYDGMGRVLAIVRRTGLQEAFTYDLLGQQVKHVLKDAANTVLATDTTDYDLQGRVVTTVDQGGDRTTYAYAWNGSLTNAGMSGATVIGGWTKTTTQWAQLGSSLWKTKSETTDVHGLTTTETDLGGNVTTYAYDRAGRLTQKQGTSGAIVTTLTNSFFNTGLVATVADSTTGMTANTITSTYAYDAMGRRTKEKYYANTLYKSLSDASYTSLSSLANQTLQDATMTYDGLGRLRTFSSTSATGTVTVNQEYDAAGNIRRTQTTYPNLVTGGTTSTDYWFTYDTMNRMVIANGALVASVIKTEDIAGALNLAYDVAGNRKTATTKYTDVVDLGDGTGRTKTVHFSNYETYYYDADNQLNQVDWHSSDGNFTTTLSTTTRDIRGRVTEYVEYASGAPSGISNHRYNIVYNARGQVSSENDFQWVSGGTDIPSAITNTYDNYGNLTYQRSVNTNGLKDTWQSWTIAWHAQADIAGSTFDRDYYGSNNNYTSTQYYDGLGRLQRAFIADGKPRAVHYALNADSQVISSVQNDGTSNDPRAYHLFANGVQIAEYTSDANEDLKNYDYQSLVATKFSNASGSGRFYHGATTGTSGAETGTSGYDPVNALTAGTSQNSRSRYTVQSGDTLQGIAASLWGDSSLWYLIADANGLSADSALTAGQGLAIPLKGPSNSNNASMFRPYDASSAVGDLNPTSAKPPKKNKCGAFGQILLAVIQVAVTAILTPAIGPVGAAAVGNVVSQGVGLVTGIQSSFSFKSLAMTVVTAGVAQGLDKVGAFTSLGINGTGALAAGARGVLTNVVSQGIGVATGLQPKFDWAGVAAAGVGAAAGNVAGKWAGKAFNLDLSKTDGKFNNLTDVAIDRGISSMASGIANAATRSIANGTDFGDNLMAALPDAIASTIGGAIEDSIANHRASQAAKAASSNGTAVTNGGTIAAPGSTGETIELTPEARQLLYGSKRGFLESEQAYAARVLTAAGGDPVLARQMIQESYGETEDQAVAESKPADDLSKVYVANDGDGNSYKGSVVYGQKHWNHDMSSFGIVEKQGDGTYTWVEDGDVTSRARADLATFDRQVGGFFVLTAGGGGAGALTGALVGYLGLAGVGGYAAKFGIGGTVSASYTEASTYALTGKHASRGQLIGSFAFGGLFAPGVAEVNAGSPVLSGAANGAFSSFGANGTGQFIDIYSGRQTDGFHYGELTFATVTGTVAGGVGGKMDPLLGRTPSLGNSMSLTAGLRYGARVQLNAAPNTAMTLVTQAHLDAFQPVFVPQQPNGGK